MKIRHFIFAAMAFIACAACQEKNITPDVPAQDQEVYTVQLGFGGEWDITYEPLTRGNDNNDLYGIQVYSAPIDENSTSTIWTPFAYGLYDDVSNVSISLLKGFKYKFEASMVVDGKNKLRLYSDGYSSPFLKYGLNYSCLNVTNGFIYSSANYISDCNKGLCDGATYLKGEPDSYNHPNTERYYGIFEGYVPEESSNDKVKIHMKRTSFGAKFIAQGKLATAGQLEINMVEAPVVLIDLANEKQHEDGSTVTVPLGTHKITYKRNATTVVKINLENTNVEGGIGFELTETGVMETVAEYEINDGNNVDTEIDTNK